MHLGRLVTILKQPVHCHQPPGKEERDLEVQAEAAQSPHWR